MIQQNNFDKRLFSSTGVFMDWKLQTVLGNSSPIKPYHRKDDKTPSLCLLRLVLPPPFSTADVFQFLDTVLCETLNVTSYQSWRCIKNRVYKNYNLRYFVYSITESLYKSFSWFFNHFQKQPPQVFHSKGCFKNLAIFTGKQLRWSLFLISSRPSSLQFYSKETLT